MRDYDHGHDQSTIKKYKGVDPHEKVDRPNLKPYTDIIDII